MKALKQPTITLRVQQALGQLDDFVTSAMLMEILDLNVNQTTAALCHLKNHKAVDCLECDGSLWWFATPATDDRSKILQERTPESKPRRPRRRRVPS